MIFFNRNSITFTIIAIAILWVRPALSDGDGDEKVNQVKTLRGMI